MNGYQLDPTKAKEGSGGSTRISETGAYTGTLIYGRELIAGTGARGVRLAFKCVDGREANFLDLYTHNKDGGETFGLKQLYALMACLKTRTLTPEPGFVKEYDFQTQKVEAIRCTLFRELTTAPIGLVLQKVLYAKANGEPGERVDFYCAFNPASRQTAAEILDNKRAEALENILLTIKDKVEKPKTTRDKTDSVGSTMPSYLDDIPFN